MSVHRYLADDGNPPQLVVAPVVAAAGHKLSSKPTFCQPFVNVDEHFHEPSVTTLLSERAALNPAAPAMLVIETAITCVLLWIGVIIAWFHSFSFGLLLTCLPST